MTRPPVLNADSEATVVIGIAKTSRATLARTGNFDEFIFHHIKASKVLHGGSTSSAKYLSISVRHNAKFLDARNGWKSVKAFFLLLEVVEVPAPTEAEFPQLCSSFDLSPLPPTFVTFLA